MWRSDHPITEFEDDATEALKEVLASMSAGDVGIPIEEFEREFRRRNGIGARQ